MFGLSEYANYGFWILQAITGLIFIVHGIPKLKNPAQIASVYHAPKFVGFLQGLVEVLGGTALIFSFYVWWVALVFALIMLGAIFYKIFVWKTGFMSHTGTGWELDLLLLGVFILILVR